MRTVRSECGRPRLPRRGQRGSSVVDFVLVLVILVPLVLGIMQVALVLHVRHTLTAAASDGARYGATLGSSPGNGAARTRQRVEGTVPGRFVTGVRPGVVAIDGQRAVQITVTAKVPPLGMFGPGVPLTVTGHAIQEGQE